MWRKKEPQQLIRNRWIIRMAAILSLWSCCFCLDVVHPINALPNSTSNLLTFYYFPSFPHLPSWSSSSSSSFDRSYNDIPSDVMSSSYMTVKESIHLVHFLFPSSWSGGNWRFDLNHRNDYKTQDIRIRPSELLGWPPKKRRSVSYCHGSWNPWVLSSCCLDPLILSNSFVSSIVTDLIQIYDLDHSSYPFLICEHDMNFLLIHSSIIAFSIDSNEIPIQHNSIY